MAMSMAEQKRKSREKLAAEGYQEISFRIQKSLLTRLDEIAARTGKSRSEVVGHLLKKLSTAL